MLFCIAFILFLRLMLARLEAATYTNSALERAH